MRGGEVNGRTWHELARVPAPVEPRCLWTAILEKTEYPERYNARLEYADVIDHDATVVTRRAHPAQGEPYIEWVTHARCDTRVEYRRMGEPWKRAQALVETDDGPCLVYQVDDVSAAKTVSDIDEAYAVRVLERLVQAAHARNPLAV